MLYIKIPSSFIALLSHIMNNYQVYLDQLKQIALQVYSN